MRRALAVIALPVAAIVGASLLLPNRTFYRDRRPTRAGRWVNARARVYGCGLFPPLLARLDVRGRGTGRVRSVPVVVARLQGQRYLVSMLGDRSEWVRNVRAAGGSAVLRHGRRERVRLVELPVERRAPVIRAYVAVAPGGRPHIPVSPGAPLADFEAVAGRYPVFRIDPA